MNFIYFIPFHQSLKLFFLQRTLSTFLSSLFVCVLLFVFATEFNWGCFMSLVRNVCHPLLQYDCNIDFFLQVWPSEKARVESCVKVF